MKAMRTDVGDIFLRSLLFNNNSSATTDVEFPTNSGVECSYAQDTQASAATRTCLFSIMLLFSMTAIMGNLTVIIVVAATTKLHTIASIFLLNLSFSDLLIGLVIMPFVADNVLNAGFAHEQTLCQVLGFLTTLCCINSIISLVAIALDRYSAIIHCLYYASTEHRRQAVGILIWTWLHAIVCSALPALGWGKYDYMPARFACSVDWTHTPGYTVFVVALCFILPLCVILFCYGRILRVARQHARRISNVHLHLSASRQNLHPVMASPSSVFGRDNAAYDVISYDFVANMPDADTLSMSSSGAATVNEPSRSFRSKSRATRRLFLVVFVFLLCWLPYVVLHLYRMATVVTCRDSSASPFLATMTTWMALMSSALNPTIYGFGNRKFRSALRRLYRKVRHRHCERNRVEEIETISRRLSAVNIPMWRSRSSSTASSLNSDARTRTTRLASFGAVSSLSAGYFTAPHDQSLQSRAIRSGSLPDTNRRLEAMSQFTTTGHFLDVPRPAYEDLLNSDAQSKHKKIRIAKSLTNLPGWTGNDEDAAFYYGTTSDNSERVGSPAPRRKRSRSESFVNVTYLRVPNIVHSKKTCNSTNNSQSSSKQSAPKVRHSSPKSNVPVTIVTVHNLDEDGLSESGSNI
uniref:G-protein coupled receptor 161-like n=1 Tax=Saccoglossus kowalevskii TaxID=10224 RepID=A0ABM0GS70_SACKO|nr:PREDICTED: G-protein coupled receptor 161-like [Saccoglossus kowalevskii]